MKKFVKLLTVMLLVANFTLSAFPTYAEEAKPSKEMLIQQNPLSAYDDLCEMFMLNGTPDNYAGEYIDGSELVILISSDDQTPYRYVSEKHNCIKFKRTEHSYKELQALLDKAIDMFTADEKGSNLVEASYIDVMKNSVCIEINAKEFIKLPKKDRDKFFIDGVNYKLVNSSFTLDSLKIAEKNGACGWNELDGERYCIKSDGTFVTKSTTINGIRYKFSSKGICSGKYSGWTKSDKGRRYWENGKLLKNKWIKTPSGKLYYAGEKGYITVGWSDVTRIGGAYSYFDNNGVWDGKVYWSKSNPEATRENMLTETVRVKIRPVQTVIGEDTKWSKKEKQYLENNSTYELELPLAVAETFNVGDTIIVQSNVTRGEKKNGVYDYHLIVSGWQPLVYAGKIGSYPYYEIADINQDGVFDEREYAKAMEQRLELFNSLFLVRNDKVMLDRLFQVLGLSWEEIKENQEFIDYVEDCHDGIYCWSGVTTYGLFGGYNRLNDETGEYVYRDGMSKKELLNLMKNVRADVLASYKEDEETGSVTDYFDWVSHSGGFWLEATVEEILSVS